MIIKGFSLYKLEGYLDKNNNDIKTEIVYIEEDVKNKTYFIKVEADKIEDILLKSKLPEILKLELREDIVNIVKDYNKLVEGKFYSDEMRTICNVYFRTTLQKFCMKHGALYTFKEFDMKVE